MHNGSHSVNQRLQPKHNIYHTNLADQLRSVAGAQHRFVSSFSQFLTVRPHYSSIIFPPLFSGYLIKMRIRLFHKIFLSVSLTAETSALAVAFLMAANLNRGFSAYLDARDQEQLTVVANQAQISEEDRGGAACCQQAQQCASYNCATWP